MPFDGRVCLRLTKCKLYWNFPVLHSEEALSMYAKSLIGTKYYV